MSAPGRCQSCGRWMLPHRWISLYRWSVGLSGRMNCGGDCWRCVEVAESGE